MYNFEKEQPGLGAESSNETKEKILQQYSLIKADIESNEFLSKPDKYIDQGSMVSIKENGHEVAWVDLAVQIPNQKNESGNEKKRQVRYMTILERDPSGKVTHSFRYDAQGNFRGSTEKYEKFGSLYNAELVKDPLGKIVSQEGYTSQEKQTFVREYTNELGQVAYKMERTQPGSRADQRMTTYYAGETKLGFEDGSLQSHEWLRERDANVAMRAY